LSIRADAQSLGACLSRGAAAILSCFGLQQMPAPAEALSAWAAALSPGGVLSAVFWPSETEAAGPFALLRRLAARFPRPAAASGASLGGAFARSDISWEERLGGEATAAGAEVLVDRTLGFPMRHDGAEGLFEAMTRSGPMRALRLRVGEAAMSELKRDFIARAGAGPLSHTPNARLFVARRK
jgi:hypothetical protein